MGESRIDRILTRTGRVVGIAFMLLVILPGIWLGYRIARAALFPKVMRNAVVNVDERTGKTEFLVLSSFHRLQGTSLLTAPLTAQGQVRDMYYSSAGYAGRVRNHLFFDLDSRKSFWLLTDNSSLAVREHALRENPGQGTPERSVELHPGHGIVDDAKSKIVGLLYEMVVKDTNRDGALTEEDQRDILLFEVAGRRSRTVLEDVDSVLGIEQASSKEVLLFFTLGRKSYFASLDLESPERREPVELAGIHAGG